ncbi:19219_t:CDS:2, partial [Funneliformis geosporum]
EIWKTFPSQIDTSNSSRFFTLETADSHLEIMINLDWFQPFDSSVYSCGIIYGVICNLSREVQFKKENILILGLLPDPKEALTGYHQCCKCANTGGRKPNFGGLEDMDNWFQE